MEDSDNNDKLKRTVSHLLIVFLGVMVGTFFFLFLAAIYFGDPIMDSILSAHGILVDTAHPNLSKIESAWLSKLVAEGTVLPASSVLSSIVAYYQSVIDIFVAVLAILGFLAYFYIRSVSARDAEKMAKKAVKDHIGSGEFRDLADAAFDRNWKSRADDAISDYADTLQGMGQYQDKVSAIEKRASEIESEQVQKNKEIDSRLLSLEEKQSGSIQLDDTESKAGK